MLFLGTTNIYMTDLPDHHLYMTYTHHEKIPKKKAGLNTQLQQSGDLAVSPQGES